MDELSPLFQEIEFHERFRGYDPDEVDAYVDRVAKAAALMRGRLTELQERVEAAEARGGTATISESEETLTRTLVLAQRTADAAIAEAREEAERLTSDAATSAQAVLSAAEAEATVYRRESEELAATTLSDAETHAAALVSEAEAERRRVIDEAESLAASAAVAERERLAAEVSELQDYREFLADDIEILERHLTDERQHLTASLSALTDLLDSPDIFRMSPPPETSGVEVDEARLAPLAIAPDGSDDDDEGVAPGDLDYSDWARATDPDPEDRPAVWVPEDLSELADKLSDGPELHRRTSPGRAAVRPVEEPEASAPEPAVAELTSVDAAMPEPEEPEPIVASDEVVEPEASPGAARSLVDPRDWDPVTYDTDRVASDQVERSVAEDAEPADEPADEPAVAVFDDEADEVDLTTSFDPQPEPEAGEAALMETDVVEPDITEPAVAAFAADVAEVAPMIDLVEASRLGMEPISDRAEHEILLEDNEVAASPPLLVTAADLDSLPSGSQIGFDSGPATAPMPTLQDRPLFSDSVDGAGEDDPFLEQLRDVVHTEADTESDDDALSAFFDHDEDDGGRSWFGRRR